MNKKLFTSLPVLLAIAVLSSCQQEKAQDNPEAISSASIKAHIAVLANDSLQGRRPFTEGETRTVNYLSAQFKEMGMAPGNNGSYIQKVPMVEITSTPSENMEITGGKTNITLKATKDFVAFSRREQDSVQLKNSPLVFAGFGIVAPEYQWNDYKNLDVKGKTVIVLVSDPGFKSDDKTVFRGDTMTYYGRWTYKFEEAARQGAAGVIIVHQTDAASYGWSVITNSNTGARLYLQQKDKHASRCKLEGWMTEEAATKLLASAGITGDIRAYARKKEFKAVSLNANVTVGLKNKLKYNTSQNVIATIKGTKRPDEYIIYTAHWDHFGIGPKINGDSIYNGAVDNASGVATMLSIAKAFQNAKEKPERSVIFLAVTGEEQGLLGSEYYASNPVYPLNKTVANLNMDALGDYGKTKDISIKGKGQNEVEDYIVAEIEKDKLYAVGDQRPSAGSYYRSDHFNFAKVGVPAVDIGNGIDSYENGKEWGAAQKKIYNDKNYHQPSDSYTDAFNADGIAQVANILFNVGYKLSNETTFPAWKKGSEFKAVRDKSLSK
ncbi:M28 family metallopeptidase [Pedobacter punctiformis]|uniref:M28 family metallopeptidase n=1 Tax=Pedobacter punctiformis TaxID=3004097 RepID=A0ABT4L8F6_9SPHI|nr:M28 family metallopeptidase [Pedobacter sp. HCMS5-2]MCZ4244212.1 M28 family metallopeptidase [Pedobacter sp. HCMS5-2]